MKPKNKSGTSVCSAATDAADKGNPGVQPAALIARITAHITWVNSCPNPREQQRAFVDGLMRAIELIQREARDAELDATG